MEIILACDAAGGIAKDGVMPWPRLAEDMKHFRDTTSGHCVIMGSKTWHDRCTPVPLPNRVNVVVSTKEVAGADMVVSGDLVIALDNLEVGPMKKFVIGGADIVLHVIPAAEVIHITEIAEDFNCDTFVPTEFAQFGFIRKETRTLSAYANYTRWEKQW